MPPSDECVGDRELRRQRKIDAPVLFSAEKEVCEQDRDRGGGQADDACGQSKKTEGIIRPRSE